MGEEQGNESWEGVCITQQGALTCADWTRVWYGKHSRPGILATATQRRQWFVGGGGPLHTPVGEGGSLGCDWAATSRLPNRNGLGGGGS